MTVDQLAMANDLLCRRAWLQDNLRAIKRGEVVISIGGKPIEGGILAIVRGMLEGSIDTDLGKVEEQLAELGVEIDDAAASPGLPPIRVESSSALAAAR